MQSNDILKKTLLLIPDISGFTRFVNDTEIIHGTHILAELLEVIIKNNNIGLKVAEIEGDAVFFYRVGEKPSVKAIYEQCEKMFLAFHQHIKLYERDRICDCGSCTHTPNLTLKFVVHYGNVIEKRILGHLQLMGPEVTTAHKLMKNNLDVHEYLLFTENIISDEKERLLVGLDFQKSESTYSDVGTVGYYYAYLKSLLDKIPEPKAREELQLDNPNIQLETTIKTSLKIAYQLLISLDKKKEWMVGLKEVKYDKSKIPRVGTEHECILPFNSLSIVTSENKVTDNKIMYAERVIGSGLLPESSHVFTLQQEGNEVKLSLDIYFNNNFVNQLFFKGMMKKSFGKSLKNFKKLAEKEFSQ
ncbi:MAG: hypothetical protein CVT95_01420 [Bacteroidetes bacterium HGW-Bacteroidetes-12]|nr:MAG: hypothetical protein CVT95_01420 [Bacteroidetes bacterium HGW-Bacteroidetes-12]